MSRSEKVLILFTILLLGLGIMFLVSAQTIGMIKIVACDVGQGDATLITTSYGSQILVDGGTGNNVLKCLGSVMPFWDRQVELIVLTHPQKDHMEGLLGVLENYKVLNIVWTGVVAKGNLIDEWQKRVKAEDAKEIKSYAGQKIAIDEISFDVLWPTREKLDEWKVGLPADLNDSSMVLKLNLDPKGYICAYLTGDIGFETLEGLIESRCQILKVSHHGSKTGTSELVADRARAQIALIEVGLKNSYGHPHAKVLDQLISKGTQIYRTDIDGQVEITYNEAQFKVRKLK